jgi:hypothetical protein
MDRNGQDWTLARFHLASDWHFHAAEQPLDAAISTGASAPAASQPACRPLGQDGIRSSNSVTLHPCCRFYLWTRNIVKWLRPRQSLVKSRDRSENAFANGG